MSIGLYVQLLYNHVYGILINNGYSMYKPLFLTSSMDFLNGISIEIVLLVSRHRFHVQSSFLIMPKLFQNFQQTPSIPQMSIILIIIIHFSNTQICKTLFPIFFIFIWMFIHFHVLSMVLFILWILIKFLGKIYQDYPQNSYSYIFKVRYCLCQVLGWLILSKLQLGIREAHQIGNYSASQAHT